MKSWLQAFLAVAITTSQVIANEVQIVRSLESPSRRLKLIDLQTQDEQMREQCSGMYSKKAWGGSADPFILTKFIKSEDADNPLVSLIVYEWRDQDLIGVWLSSEASEV